MATIQDALAALEQKKKTPLSGLLEGVASGFQSAQNNSLERAKTLILLEQNRQQIERQQQMDQQIRAQLEGKTQNDLRSTGTAPTLTPAQKLKTTIKQDEKGQYSRSFETVDETPKAVDFYTPEATRALMPGAKTENLIKAYPDGKIPKDAVHQLMSTGKTDASLGEKKTLYTQKRLTALGDALDASKQRQGAFGTSKQVFDRAERLQSLASAFPDGNLDSRQMEEIAIGLNAMLSGSNTGAQSQVESLVPKTIMGNAQKLAEWLSNNPKGTNQQEFVKRMMGSVEREKQTAADQIKRTQMQRVSRYSDLEKDSPDEFYNTLQSAGLDPEEYKSWVKGGRKNISAVQGAEGGTSSGTGKTIKVGRFTVEVH